MKRSTIIIGLATLAGFLWARDAGWFRSSTPISMSSTCPQIARGAISLPDSHAEDLAMMMNAADTLNNRMSICVIEGSWSESSRTYYLAVQERGKKPEIRNYTGAQLRGLASLGQR